MWTSNADSSYVTMCNADMSCQFIVCWKLNDLYFVLKLLLFHIRLLWALQTMYNTPVTLLYIYFFLYLVYVLYLIQNM